MPMVELTEVELAKVRLALNAAEAMGILLCGMSNLHHEELMEIERRFRREPRTAEPFAINAGAPEPSRRPKALRFTREDRKTLREFGIK